MARGRVLVVGSGLAGLAVGCQACTAGWEATVFEQHTEPGGVAASWRRGDYLIEGGVHHLVAYAPGQSQHWLYDELGIAEPEDMFVPPLYGRFIDEATGRIADLGGEPDELRERLQALFPGDRRHVDQLLDAACALGRVDLGASLRRAPELGGMRDRLEAVWSMRAGWRHMAPQNLRATVEATADWSDRFLAWTVQNFFLPDVTLFFVELLLGLTLSGQFGVPKGGSLGLVEPLVQRLRDLGGELRLGADVRKVLVDGDRAVGVRLADGTEERGDVVVSAADAHATMYELLGGRYVDAAAERRFREWRLVQPILNVGLGVARTFEGEPWLRHLRLEEPIDTGGLRTDSAKLRTFNFSDRFAPAGKTSLSLAFDADWAFWRALRDDLPRYRAEKERVADDALRLLERYHPGISSQVEAVDVSTPFTTWRYTRNLRGAYTGWFPPTFADTVKPLPRKLPGLERFYMTGQWVVPGGGVPSVLAAARHTVQVMERELPGRGA